MIIDDISEMANCIADLHSQQQKRWRTYCNSLIQGLTLSKASLYHSVASTPTDGLCFTRFDHFTVHVGLADGFYSHTIEYRIAAPGEDSHHLIARASLDKDGMIDREISCSDREQVLCHYLGKITPICEQLLDFMVNGDAVVLAQLVCGPALTVQPLMRCVDISQK